MEGLKESLEECGAKAKEVFKLMDEICKIISDEVASAVKMLNDANDIVKCCEVSEDKTREIIDGEVVNSMDILNGMRNGISVTKYKTDICDKILITITEILKPETSASSFSRLLREEEASRIGAFLMKEISKRLEISPDYVLVQAESCLII